MKTLLLALITAGLAYLAKWLIHDYDPTINWAGPLDGKVDW